MHRILLCACVLLCTPSLGNFNKQVMALLSLCQVYDHPTVNFDRELTTREKEIISRNLFVQALLTPEVPSLRNPLEGCSVATKFQYLHLRRLMNEWGEQDSVKLAKVMLYRWGGEDSLRFTTSTMPVQAPPMNGNPTSYALMRFDWSHHHSPAVSFVSPNEPPTSRFPENTVVLDTILDRPMPLTEWVRTLIGNRQVSYFIVNRDADNRWQLSNRVGSTRRFPPGYLVLLHPGSLISPNQVLNPGIGFRQVERNHFSPNTLMQLYEQWPDVLAQYQVF